MRSWLLASLSLFLLLTSGCAGSAKLPKKDGGLLLWQHDLGLKTSDSRTSADVPKNDSSFLGDVPGQTSDAGKRDGTTSSSCPSESTVTNCDPQTNDGCPAGSGCYWENGLSGWFTTCVCPAGKKLLNAACANIGDCAPTMVCLGTTADGYFCRKVCTEWNKTCPASQTCYDLSSVSAGYGYCDY